MARFGGASPVQLTCRFAKTSLASPAYTPCMLEAFKFNNPYSEQFEYVVATARLLDSIPQDVSPVVVSGGAQPLQEQPQPAAGFDWAQARAVSAPGPAPPAQHPTDPAAVSASVVAAAAVAANYQPQLPPANPNDPWLHQPLQEAPAGLYGWAGAEPGAADTVAQTQWNGYLNQ